jgi:hypothetical protein
MKYLIAILLILLLHTPTQAQNIVPNPSFAADSLCPTDVAQLNYCKYWRTPTLGTSDYFNACSPASSGVSVPRNLFGYKSSYDNAYTGFITYYPFIANYREYVATTIAALQVGATYQVTIVVSFADSFSFSSDGLGAYFSMNPITTFNQTVLAVTPQIEYSNYGVLHDTLNWVTLSKTFIADSAYTNIVVGEFKNDATINLLSFNGKYAYAYYYMDSVAVEKIGEAAINDTHTHKPLSQVYPNPFSSHATLHFEYVQGQLYTLTIYNIQGKEVSKTENLKTGDVALQGLEKGFYFYKLSNANTLMDNGKFIVK